MFGGTVPFSADMLFPLKRNVLLHCLSLSVENKKFP